MAKTADAEIDLTRAIEINRSATSLSTRALARRSLGKYQEALKDIDAAISLDQSNDKYLLNRALILVDMNKLREAIVSFDLAIAVNPQDPDYFVDRGRAKLIYWTQNSNSNLLIGAVEDTEEAVSLSEMMESGGKTSEDGIETATTTLGRVSGQGKQRYYLLYGNVLQQSGRLRDAEAAYSKSIEIDPADGRAHANRAVVRLQLGDKLGGTADLRYLEKNHPEILSQLMQQLE